MRAILVVTAALLIAFLVGRRSPATLVFAASFTSAWQGIDVDIGLRVTAFTVVTAGMCGVWILRMLAKNRQMHARSLREVSGILFYAVIVSVAMIPFLPGADVAGGVMRAPGLRTVSQIVMFIFTLVPIFVVHRSIDGLGDIRKIAKIYIVSVVLLVSCGWIQLLIWKSTGTNPFPIGYFGSLLTGQEVERSAIAYFRDQQIFRMSSFAGEPKNLGSAVAMALLLMQAGVRQGGVSGACVWGYLIAGMIATLSTMGMIIWAAGSAAQLAIYRRRNRPRRSRDEVLLGLGIAIIVGPILAAWVAFTETGGSFLSIMEARTVGRAQDSDYGLMEEFNWAIWEFLRNEPLAAVTGVGLGNAHLFAAEYLPSISLYYAEGTAFVAKSAPLRWVSEIGGVTLMVFIYWVFKKKRAALRTLKLNTDAIDIADVVEKTSVPFIVAWCLGYVSPQFFMYLGVLVGVPMAGRMRTWRWVRKGIRNK